MSNIFSLSGSGKPGAGSTTPQTAALDNLIRRELKISDPRDPAQVAEALMARYQGDPRAQAIDQEANGAPFLQSAPQTALPLATQTSSSREWEQAVSDIDSDLQELTINALLRDELPEIKGWAQALHSILEQGKDASRLALDARQRDKAFSMRRQLCDFARMVRLVGVTKRTKIFSSNYRSLAQSIDEAAAMLLVLMGEAIASSGFNNGQELLQTPFSEMQARRDELLLNLRGLTSSINEARSENAMPRGLAAYRDLLETLSSSGQGDLRSLLVESELLRATDDLMQRAADGATDGSRILASNTQIELNRFRRLLAVADGVEREPPLLAFLKALQLFIEAFDTAGGARLLYAARPSLLFYGLYGGAVSDHAARRLPHLLQLRCELAEALDKVAEQAAQMKDGRQLTHGDILLWSVDRAIDYYVTGQPGSEVLEVRASLVGALIEHAQLPNEWSDVKSTGAAIARQLSLKPCEKDQRTAEIRHRQLHAELKFLVETEFSWDSLVRAMAPVALASLHPKEGSAFDLYANLKGIIDDIKPHGVDISIPPHFEDTAHKILQVAQKALPSSHKHSDDSAKTSGN